MKNRYGNMYEFEAINHNTYRIVGELDYWRYGGLEGQEGIDLSNLGFVDPAGGPFIGIGYNIQGRKVTKIYVVNGEICLTVEDTNILAGADLMSDKGYSVSTLEKQAEFARKRCWCHTCRPITIEDMRMVLCPECGNKRCPKANNHANECTNSNDTGQIGSAYP